MPPFHHFNTMAFTAIVFGTAGAFISNTGEFFLGGMAVGAVAYIIGYNVIPKS